MTPTPDSAHAPADAADFAGTGGPAGSAGAAGAGGSPAAEGASSGGECGGSEEGGGAGAGSAGVLLGPSDVRELAAALGVRPTKQRGQNFVIDANTVRRIVRTSGVGAGDTVLEVGPGLGSLTLALLETAERVTAVEIDDQLAAGLPSTVAARLPHRAGRFALVHTDAMRLTEEELPGPPPTALVANLPYNVAVPVLLHMLSGFPTLERALVMVQSEVADRLAAPPGSKVYGVPSVKAAWYCDVRRAGAIGRNVFWPAPNVDSGLVSLVRRDPPATAATREEVFAVVDAAFAQRRKTLRSALAGWAGSAAAAEEALTRAGVSPKARGEALTVGEFAAIAEHRGTHAPERGHEPARGQGRQQGQHGGHTA